MGLRLTASTALLLTGAFAAQAVFSAPSPATGAAKCAPGFAQATVERIRSGVVSYSLEDGKKGALPQAMAGVAKVGAVFCLPGTGWDASEPARHKPEAGGR